VGFEERAANGTCGKRRRFVACTQQLRELCGGPTVALHAARFDSALDAPSATLFSAECPKLTR
jgi:hypothetical protein